MATFLLELVSPEKLLLSRQVEMATIPAEEGEMGVLPGHSPMIVALRGGVIRVRENGAETEKLFIAGGFAEVSPERVTILADEATPLANLSRTASERRLAEAEAALQEAVSEPEPKRDAAYARVQALRTAVSVAEAA
ncbi:ATP synthase F1 subunit epsilon [Belnapia rosea]|uniref:ATP synthase epsilon chain n=1 Tax=Belnapia rosea TaxID=938405 RepID=A0A1G6VQ38_9PROT|nr:ATP synthase F1 subunit epsilon [Belnapia rosea]SDB36317.1 F-type H+-transporting ATPase subunit epsilon [Belnapia rosea]SDD55698.1 ATP synthase F1 subcomplex epsilon subunit [Belnapia rosea]